MKITSEISNVFVSRNILYVLLYERGSTFFCNCQILQALVINLLECMKTL